MKLTRYKLGDLLIQHNIKNSDNSLDNVKGISVKKEFREPTSKVNRDELSNYKLVYPNQFGSIQTTHNEKCFAFAYNDTKDIILISSVNLVFSIIDESILLPRWLQLYFNRPEFDRYARFNSWGSARETFSWKDICDIEIELPPLDIQQKYVDVYNAMLSNQKSYEKGLEDLKLVCDAYIEDLRRNIPCEEIGEYIDEVNERNSELDITLTQGIDINMKFIPAKREAKDKENTNVVKNSQFAFNKVVKSNGTKLPIALREGEDCIISGSYQVFEVTNKNKLLPEYLMLWMSRSETHRYCGFNAWGSTRDVFPFEEMKLVKIPIPDIKVQQSIVDIYKVYKKRKEINEKLKTQIKDICKILIRGSIEEAKR